MKQALIIADSIGAPREKPLKTYYRDTWVSQVEDYLLNKGYKTFAYTQRAADSSHMKHRIDVQLKWYKPDLVICQFGIVDCAPRILKANELRVINRIPIFNKIVHKFISKNYTKLSLLRNIAYTDNKLFRENLEYIKGIFSNSKVLVVPIGIPNQAYIEKSPKIDKRIEEYNNIFCDVFNKKYVFLQGYIDLSKKVLEKIYSEDNHHLNYYGHKLLHDVIIEHIEHNNLL